MLSNTFVQNSGSNGGAVWQNNVKKVNHTLNLFVGNSAPKGSGGIELNQVGTCGWRRQATCGFGSLVLPNTTRGIAGRLGL